MLSEDLKEQQSDAQTTEPEPPKKKIPLLVIVSHSDDESKHASVCTALDRYRAEPIISMDTSPLEWWLKHEGPFESLTHLVRKYLAIFSGDIVNNKQAELSPANVNKLVCLSD
ncbi:hypothetical protein UY3_01522 [Chelonia mydas]|uniref:HAT C-terminal dimerisation domain-containing protein n=1 Tax=Chelonia mydas TaxID=8469 RepID=M7BTX9_CHEMY|nr:hypothetical protein UY3_01522 [Chelonia mydas]